MAKIKVRGRRSKPPEHEYQLDLVPTTFGGGEREIVVKIDGSAVISFLCPVGDERKPTCHVFVATMDRAGFNTEVAENL